MCVLREGELACVAGESLPWARLSVWPPLGALSGAAALPSARPRLSDLVPGLDRQG